MSRAGPERSAGRPAKSSASAHRRRSVQCAVMSGLVDRTRHALRSRGNAYFLAASLVLGLLVGIGASLLVWGIDIVRQVFERSDEIVGVGRWIFAISVPLGLLASWLLDRRFGPGVAGGGVTETMVGVNLEGGYIPTRLAPAKIAATATSLGSGGSGGREGPIVLIGGAIGSSLGRYSRFGFDQIKSFVAAGAGAGIGASFNAPIAGMMFALEVILSSFAVRHVSSVVVTSVAAAVTTQALVGEELFLRSPRHILADPRQLVLYTGLAVIAMLFGLLFLRVLDVTSDLRTPKRMPRWVLPIAAGALVGLVGVAYPETLGTGQQFLSEVLALEDAAGFTWAGLFVVAALKSVTAAVTKQGGGSVGTFMPSLVIGGAAGAAFAILIDPIWGLSDIDPGAYALVGMAAALAATARAPLTAVILVFELTGDYGLVLPLMLAAALATFVGDRAHPESAYTMSLAKKGIRLPEAEDIDLLDTVLVREVMSEVDVVATPDQSLEECEAVLATTKHHGLPVMDAGRLVGVISTTDLDRASHHSRTVRDEMTPRPITITADVPVSAALAQMASLGIGRLPVVDEHEPGKLIGMFRRESVVKAYHHALGTTTGRHMYRERLRLRTHPGATFFEAELRTLTPLVGSQIQDAAWPDDLVVVSVRRGSSVLIPHGNTSLRIGDVITCFGTGEAREELGFLLEPHS